MIHIYFIWKAFKFLLGLKAYFLQNFLTAVLNDVCAFEFSHLNLFHKIEEVHKCQGFSLWPVSESWKIKHLVSDCHNIIVNSNWFRYSYYTYSFANGYIDSTKHLDIFRVRIKPPAMIMQCTSAYLDNCCRFPLSKITKTRYPKRCLTYKSLQNRPK